MYTYIMERTQIYLTKRESETLKRLSERTGRTRSQLIREAIASSYLDVPDSVALRRALAATAGLWSDRSESGAGYVDRLRRGRLVRRLTAADR
jgi:predicted DNA-binding protein